MATTSLQCHKCHADGFLIFALSQQWCPACWDAQLSELAVHLKEQSEGATSP